MFRSISIALAIAGVLAVGALTAVAANAHGSSVSRQATTIALKAAAKGDAISTLARAKGQAKSDAAKAEAAAKSTATDTEANDEDADEATDATADAATDKLAESDKHAHGDAVSAVAKSDATAPHENGGKNVNHGGAVSEAAEKD
jgi:hypothetical protein